jgi:hypothetical protein
MAACQNRMPRNQLINDQSIWRELRFLIGSKVCCGGGAIAKSINQLSSRPVPIRYA